MRDGPPVAGTLGGAESSLDQKQGGARGSIATRQGGAKPRRAKRDRLDARVDALLAVQPVSLRAGQPAKSTSAVVTVPAVRPGARWYCQYRFVCAITCAGAGAPYSERSSVVCASATRVAS